MSIVSRFVSLVIAVSGKEWLLPTKHTFALWLLLFRLFFAAATTTFWASPAAALLLSVRCAMAISGGKNASHTAYTWSPAISSWLLLCRRAFWQIAFFASPTASFTLSAARWRSPAGRMLPTLRTRGLRPFLLGCFFAGGVLAIAF